jgi:hypothetical protein
MATSTRYKTLESRITQIDDHLLPAVKPDLSYTDKDQDLIRSFCLLCHAEFEAYLEDITLEIATLAIEKWKKKKEEITPIIFHLAYSFRNEAGKKREPPYSMVILSYEDLKSKVKKNNGIKEENITNFFRPLGFSVDSTLQTTLTDYGITRGQIAHTSFHTQQPLDPSTEKSRVKLILSGLAALDIDIFSYESTGTVGHKPVYMYWDKLSFLERIRILFTGRF